MTGVQTCALPIWIPVIASFLAIAVNVGIVLLTIDSLQHRAIALATSGTMLLNFLFLMTVLYFSLGGYPLRRLFLGAGKVALATALLSLVLFLAKGAFATWWAGDLLRQGAVLGASIAVATLSYTTLLSLLGLSELNVFVEKLGARFRRRG